MGGPGSGRKKLEYEIVVNDHGAADKVGKVKDSIDGANTAAGKGAAGADKFGGSLASMAGQAFAAVGGMQAVIQLLNSFKQVADEAAAKAQNLDRKLADIAAERGGTKTARADVRDVVQAGAGLTTQEAANLLDLAADLGFKGKEATRAAIAVGKGRNILGMGETAADLMESAGAVSRSTGMDIEQALAVLRATGDRAITKNLGGTLTMAKGAGFDPMQVLALMKNLTEQGMSGREARFAVSGLLSQAAGQPGAGGDLERAFRRMPKGAGSARIGAALENLGVTAAELETAGAQGISGAANAQLDNDKLMRMRLQLETMREMTELERIKKANYGGQLNTAELEFRAAQMGPGWESIYRFNANNNPFFGTEKYADYQEDKGTPQPVVIVNDRTAPLATATPTIGGTE